MHTQYAYIIKQKKISGPPFSISNMCRSVTGGQMSTFGSAERREG